MSNPSPEVAVSAPARSRERGALSLRLSGSAAGASTSVARATGTLTNRTHRQPRNSVITPPPTMPTEPQGRHRTVDADGAVALFPLCKDGRKQRERGRHERCCAHPMNKASADEDPRLPGEPTYERGRTKEIEPCHEEALPPVKITCAPQQ